MTIDGDVYNMLPKKQLRAASECRAKLVISTSNLLEHAYVVYAYERSCAWGNIDD